MRGPISRKELIDLLNGDLSREYQAIIAYVIYSQTLTGAQYMAIAKELEPHAKQELDHAITIAKQIDYLGGTPTAEPKPVRISSHAKEMLQFDLDNEGETIQNYRQRVRQCEALSGTRWRKRSARSCASNRNTRSIWPPRSGGTSRP